ncbi:F-BOX/KELCH-REPEAT PLANT PROTEIN [Salix purpurea]|uniref:F-BOX/KELCH-REPEAT PLANT PROTEIN n=1 Tax=Salix purpurea TaxID=77065 RepID=A0A9Q0SJ66_SALPP|nr:F-BOX/KELCH-REPEAT PLANT PROTEIN [Salix purpurea]
MMPKSLQSPSRLPEMDPAIWSRLPEELLENVLSFLPLKTFLNLRSTCKHFKSLMFSRSFMSRHTASGSPFSSFLLLSHPQFYQEFPLYDSIVGSWRNLTLSLSLLLPGTGSNVSPSCTLLSSSNGLICFSLPSSCSLLVCNFVAKSSRIVEFPTHPLTFESFVFVPVSSGYKIFVLCSKFSSNSVFVYDSKVHSWQKFDRFEPILGDNYRQEGVFFNGSLYFTTSEPFSIVCFALESGRWERLDSELPGDLTFVRLVSDGKKKLYLIGGVGRNGISRSMKLWELDDKRDWIEVESLPEMMCKKFLSVCYHNYERVYCFLHEGMICICCYTWPEILYYKISRRTWHWLPKCPSLPEKWSCGFRWFSFVPELHALV